jgi:(1->4)-alpha-D-glucan 1-alpha-D-glucosylmutase
LSTHDTKRAADTRARLAVLTTIPDALVAAFDAWSAVAVALAPGVHPADRWLVFQTLVGSHPMPVERAWPVIEKSLREAKLRSSWTEPDDAYEKEACRLVEATTVDPELGRHVAALAEEVADAGWAAALEQLALQLLTPGVPDVYQGGESWDLSVVDPDNRRGVDPVRRRDAVQRAGATSVADAWRDPGARRRGVPRAALLRTALGVRRRQPAAVGSGDVGAYHPLGAEGSDAGRVLAFARGGPALEDAVVAVVAARPGPGAQIGADANVALPGGSWVDLVTGDQVDDRLDLAGRPLPIAVLER